MLAAGLTTAIAVPSASAANGGGPVSGAVSTTVNEAVDGTGHCQNGNPNVNCNQYDGKQFVWLSGLPDSAGLSDGTYFFAVTVPGGQGNNITANPNDGTDKNLSDTTAAPWGAGDQNADGSAIPSGDAYTNRTFSLTNGQVGYAGTHDFANNKIRLFPYDDTTNPGGVYILAVCKIVEADGTPVELDPSFGEPGINPSLCKYDAFMVRAEGTETPPAKDLVVTKDANGSYDTTYAWNITKSVDKTRVEKAYGDATFNYEVQVTHDAGTTSNVKVTGTIEVTNPNAAEVTGVDITDLLSTGTECQVTGGTDATIPAEGSKTFAYVCDLGDSIPDYGSSLSNTVTVTWPDQDLGTAGFLFAGSASFKFKSISLDENLVDECVNVTDSFAGDLGTVCVGDQNPMTFTYSRTVPIPRHDCVSYDNTATFVTNDTGTTDSASQSVTACRVPPVTGARTIGFWQNSNGQAVIKSANQGALKSFVTQYAPFQDIGTRTVARYTLDVIKAAKCTDSTNTCNSMLKAQMLATTLDAYFTGPGWSGTTVKKFFPTQTNLGGVKIDLTTVCKDLSGCTTYEDVSSAFGGAASLTVSQMLAYAASQSNVGGSLWYGQVKSTQVLAKDAFDAINNQKAYEAAP